MKTTNLNIRTDKKVKAAAKMIFQESGLTMTTAVNFLLRQSIRENGISFELKLNIPNDVTSAAIAEGKNFARDINKKGCGNMDDLKEALEV